MFDVYFKVGHWNGMCYGYVISAYFMYDISHTKSLNSNAAKIHLLMSQIAQIVRGMQVGGWMPIVNIRQQLGKICFQFKRLPYKQIGFAGTKEHAKKVQEFRNKIKWFSTPIQFSCLIRAVFTQGLSWMQVKTWASETTAHAFLYWPLWMINWFSLLTPREKVRREDWY